MHFPIKKGLGVKAFLVTQPRSVMRKYRLTALFGLTALLLVLTAAVVMSYAIGRIAEKNLTRIAEKSITADAVDMLTMIGRPGAPLTLEALASPEGLPKQLPVVAQKYSIVKLSLIDPDCKTVWSTDRQEIGTAAHVGPTSLTALSGTTASTFLPDQELSELDGLHPRLSVVQTSLPLRDYETSKVIGVLEIFRNVTEEVPFLIGATRSSVLRVTAATMGGLFIVLLLAVVVADVAISRSENREKATLESQLAERRQAAEALLDSNLRLEEVVDELKKTQEQIVQQERLRALGEMASGIAHDFNNALTPILGYSSLLINQPEKLNDPEAVQNQLKVINTAAEDAAAVVSRLKEFYRSRDEHEQFETIDLNALASQVVSLTQAKWKDQALARGVTIQVHTNLSNVPPVMGIASQLREALMNLVLNAVDAMPEGGNIAIETQAEAGHVMLEVSDTGAGMTEEVRQRCLDPFFTTKGSHGTGMGLAMVYGIVQRHRGKMDIKTQLGRGTSFNLQFPVTSPSPAEVNGPKDVQGSVDHLRVLVVDDEPMILELFKEYLESDGHVVSTAANGRQAADMFSSGTFDVVLTDQAMPEMSGDQLAIAVKQLSPATPVVLVTGFGAIMLATDEKLSGVDLVLGKPVGFPELRQAIALVTGSAEPGCLVPHNHQLSTQNSSLELAAV